MPTPERVAAPGCKLATCKHCGATREVPLEPAITQWCGCGKPVIKVKAASTKATKRKAR